MPVNILKRLKELERRIAALEPAKLIHVPAIIDQINRAVAKDAGMELNLMLSYCKQASVFEARALAMYLAHHITGYNSTRLGRIYQRDHVTILNAIRAVSNRVDTEPVYHEQVATWLTRFQKPTPNTA